MSAYPKTGDFQRLRDGVQQVISSGQWARFLSWQAKTANHNYSLRNWMLIYTQRPDATMLRGYQSWKSDFNRHVNRGERGIRIIAPIIKRVDAQGTPSRSGKVHQLVGFRVVTVFDVSQTSGEPIPPNPMPLAVTQQTIPEQAKAALIAMVVDRGFAFQEADWSDDAPHGSTDFDTKTVTLKTSLNDAHQIKTLLHELAHIDLHSDKERRHLIGRPAAELEAESTAFLVCAKLGIDTGSYSFGYLTGWAEGEIDRFDEVMDVLNQVQRTSSSLWEELAIKLDLPTERPSSLDLSTQRHRLEDRTIRPSKSPISPPTATFTRISDDTIQEAKRTDPTPYLLSAGYDVTWEGYNADVRQAGIHAMRITRKPDGTYLVNSDTGEPRGDMIDLAKYIEGTSDWKHALNAYLGANHIDVNTIEVNHHAPSKWEPPRIKTPNDATINYGRAYLNRRGISHTTIMTAEQSGMLTYNYGGVIFTGRDVTGTIMAAFRRGYLPDDPTPKRDLRGSRKEHAPILPGQNPSLVWIVEGGMDALAVHDLYHREGRPTPTVIVAGGAGSSAYTQSEVIAPIISNAKRIVIASDNDANPDTKVRIELQRDRTITAIKAIAPHANIDTWMPASAKDVADYNQAIVQASLKKNLPPHHNLTNPQHLTR